MRGAPCAQEEDQAVAEVLPIFTATDGVLTCCQCMADVTAKRVSIGEGNRGRSCDRGEKVSRNSFCSTGTATSTPG